MARVRALIGQGRRAVPGTERALRRQQMHQTSSRRGQSSCEAGGGQEWNQPALSGQHSGPAAQQPQVWPWTGHSLAWDTDRVTSQFRRPGPSTEKRDQNGVICTPALPVGCVRSRGLCEPQSAKRTSATACCRARLRQGRKSYRPAWLGGWGLAAVQGPWALKTKPRSYQGLVT